MELNDQCYCCLLRPVAKGLKTPYTRLGTTEIYSDMLEECFKIHLLDSEDECGICEVCVDRLRDASNFKLQVQRSQAELRAQLETALHIKNELSSVKSELSGGDVDEEVYLSDELKSEKSDPMPSEEGDAEWNYVLDLDLKSDDEVDIKEETDMTSRRSVRLARSRGDEASPTAECEATDHDSGLMKLRSQIRTHKKKYRCENTTFHELDMTETTCDVCDKKFTSERGRKQHELTHMKNKPYSCDVCKKRFAGVSMLTHHKRTHRKKEFCCEICGKQCSCLFGLNYHKLTHTGEKPYDCDMCHKRFTSKPGLKAHLLIHSGLKPYSCGVCGKKFRHSSGFKRHKLIHTDNRPEFPCDICGNKFLAKQKLQTHRMIHTGEKPHSCQICGKDFRAKNNLKTHMEIHAEGKTYSCEVCPKTYSTKESLRQHKRVHTKNAGKSKRD